MTTPQIRKKPTVRGILEKIKGANKEVWLSKPIYHGFNEALRPKAMTSGDDFLCDLDPYQQALWKHVYEDMPLTCDTNQCVAMALGYQQSDLIRSYLNGLIFGGANTETVQKVTQLDLRSIEAYISLFCDISVFKGARLFLLDYIHKLPVTDDTSKKEKNFYKMAFDFGWEWVQWSLTRGLQGHRAPIQIVDCMINLAFYRAIEAAASPLNSAKAKEGRHYLKMAANMALNKHRSKMGTLTNIQDLVLKLTSMSPEELEQFRAGIVETQEILPDVSELLYKSDDADGSDVGDDLDADD